MGGVQTPGRFPGGADADNFGGGYNDAGLTGQNKLVFNYISACTEEQGIHFQSLKNKCRGMQEKQLRYSTRIFISITLAYKHIQAQILQKFRQCL